MQRERANVEPAYDGDAAGLKDEALVTASYTNNGPSYESSDSPKKLPLNKRILGIVWDSLDKTPAERKFLAKVDWWILTYCCIAYFVKYLDQTNVSLEFLDIVEATLELF